MDIVGLGKAGCAIAEMFRKYPQYKNIYKIDVGIEGDKCFSVAKRENPEDYEKNIPVLEQFFSDAGEEILFIIAGSGNISTMSLGILEQIKDRKINIIYIKPSSQTLIGQKRILDKITFGILQEYTRSGLFETLCVIDNQKVIDHIGSISVLNYWNRINEFISSSIHFINVFNNTEEVYGVEGESPPTNRIRTIGILDPQTSEEKMFFDLDMIKEKRYFYAFRKELLAEDSGLLKNIETKLEAKKETWLTSMTYRLYVSSYDKDYGYCVHLTSKVQEET